MAILMQSIKDKMNKAAADLLGKQVMISLHSGRTLDQRAKKMIGIPKIVKWGEQAVFKFDKDQYISWFGVWSGDGELLMINRPDWRNAPIMLCAGSTLFITPRFDLTF